MSISLRKACQPALDAANLPYVHVGVKNKVLTIVGPCGQPLVSISGIEFDTNTPKKMEIPYALQLFERFLSEKAEDIATYLEAKKAFSELVLPNLDDIPQLRNTYRGIIYTTPGYEVEYSSKDQRITDISTRDSYKMVSEELAPLIAKADFTAKPYFAALNKYKAKESELQLMQSQLQTCNI